MAGSQWAKRRNNVVCPCTVGLGYAYDSFQLSNGKKSTILEKNAHEWFIIISFSLWQTFFERLKTWNILPYLYSKIKNIHFPNQLTY